MIKTEFPYSYRGQDLLVSARCHSVDSCNADGLKIKFIDPETLDFIDVYLDEAERDELEEHCILELESKQSELDVDYAY